jgi:hypothetical protein
MTDYPAPENRAAIRNCRLASDTRAPGIERELRRGSRSSRVGTEGIRGTDRRTAGHRWGNFIGDVKEGQTFVIEDH